LPSLTRSQASGAFQPHYAANNTVSAGKWRVCIDTSNLLGGPYQMVFTTNGIKQVLDNVYEPPLQSATLLL
jgi:hypothetical protein